MRVATVGALIACLLLVACGEKQTTQSTSHKTTPTIGEQGSSGSEAREAAVELVMADLNARNDPHATTIRGLRRLIGPYISRTALDRRVATRIGPIRAARSDGWRPPRLDAITVGAWSATDISGPNGSVTFVGYITNTTPQLGTLKLPLERWTVEMRWEDRRWRLVDFQTDWLSSAGPMGVPGDEAIRVLPEHVRFPNPRSVRRAEHS